ncbi:MAG TPA: 6-pyruvoyl-tetrahydropterin synthase-related protein [Polyangia bacterium]
MLRDRRFLLVVAVAIGLWVPLARLNWFASHEMGSYVIRTVEWAVESRAGTVYPRWCPDFYGGYGSPFFVFHGPVVYGLAGFLHATVLNPFGSLKVVMLLASILAGVGAYALVFGETRDRDAALLGAVAYLAAPYRLGDLYERGDLAEFTCIAILPVAVALYRAVAREALPRRAQRLAVAASVAHAIMIMTHPVMGLWGTFVIGLVVLISVVRFAARRAIRRALLLAGAMACAPGLAAVYIVPALVYRGIVQTPAMVTSFYDPQENWIRFGTLFASSTPEFARNFLRMGPVLLAAAIVVLLGLARNPRQARPALAWMGFGALLVFLALPQGRAFWAWNSLPLVSFTQFPWRLLGPAALLASVALGIGSARAWEGSVLKGPIAIVGAGMLLIVVARPYVSGKEMPTDMVPLDTETIRQWRLSTTSADEFLPSGAVVPAQPAPANLVATTDGVVVEHTSNQGSHLLLVLRANRDSANVGLALHGFPGWVVKTAAGPGGAHAELQTDSHGLLRLRLPVAGMYRLRLWFGVSGAESVGLFLSTCFALVLGLGLVHSSRPWPRRLPVNVPHGSAL